MNRTCGVVALVSLGICGVATGGPRVVLISVDGLRPDAITPETAPVLTGLMQRGTHAGTCYNDLPSATLPNHATMLTGLVADTHGLLVDFDIPGTIPQPTLFDFAAAAGLRGAFFASKTKLRFLAHPDVLDTTVIDTDTDSLTQKVLARLVPDGPDAIFVHLRDPDSNGHRSGWMSQAYLDAVTRIDGQIGQIVAALDADTSRESYLIVTADHGGTGLNHFLNVEEDRRIPWIIIGPDIEAGRMLAAPISIVDTTPTVLWLLGVTPPDDLDGRVLRELRDPAAGPDSPLAVPPIGFPCMLFAVPPLALTCWAAGRGSDGCRRG